jgi:hypothetical protein
LSRSGHPSQASSVAAVLVRILDADERRGKLADLGSRDDISRSALLSFRDPAPVRREKTGRSLRGAPGTLPEAAVKSPSRTESRAIVRAQVKIASAKIALAGPVKAFRSSLRRPVCGLTHWP